MEDRRCEARNETSRGLASLHGAWRRGAFAADRGSVHNDGAEPPDEQGRRGYGDAPIAWGGPLRGDGAATQLDVQLRREFKGLTVRDLVSDLGLDEQLPGRVASALEHIRRGDYAAAERMLPGTFGAVLEGPFAKSRRSRRRIALWIVLSALAAALASATMTLL